MNYELILVRFGEITIKGRNRNRFEKMQLDQIQTVLSGFPALTYERAYGRVYIRLNGESYDRVAPLLKDVFGIVSFSPVVKVPHELEAIREASLSLLRQLTPAPRTFKVSVRRGWKGYPHTSPEMNHLVGSHLLRNTPSLKVDVQHPDAELRVDIQFEGAFIYCEVERGAGGFPLGMNGKAMLLLSGGIDSPVAGWMALRKGLAIEAVHFHSYPFTSEQAKEKVVALAKRLSHYSGKIKLHLVPFTDIQTMLAQSDHYAYATGHASDRGTLGGEERSASHRDGRQPRPSGQPDARQHERHRPRDVAPAAPSARDDGQARHYRPFASDRHVPDVDLAVRRLLHLVRAEVAGDPSEPVGRRAGRGENGSVAVAHDRGSGRRNGSRRAFRARRATARRDASGAKEANGSAEAVRVFGRGNGGRLVLTE